MPIIIRVQCTYLLDTLAFHIRIPLVFLRHFLCRFLLTCSSVELSFSLSLLASLERLRLFLAGTEASATFMLDKSAFSSSTPTSPSFSDTSRSSMWKTSPSSSSILTLLFILCYITNCKSSYCAVLLLTI